MENYILIYESYISSVDTIGYFILQDRSAKYKEKPNLSKKQPINSQRMGTNNQETAESINT